MFVTPEELLAGGEMTFDIEIPPAILHPTPNGEPEPKTASAKKMRLRPLTVHDVQLIAGKKRKNRSCQEELLASRSSS